MIIFNCFRNFINKIIFDKIIISFLINRLIIVLPYLMKRYSNYNKNKKKYTELNINNSKTGVAKSIIISFQVMRKKSLGINKLKCT